MSTFSKTPDYFSFSSSRCTARIHYERLELISHLQTRNYDVRVRASDVNDRNCYHISLSKSLFRRANDGITYYTRPRRVYQSRRFAIVVRIERVYLSFYVNQQKEVRRVIDSIFGDTLFVAHSSKWIDCRC